MPLHPTEDHQLVKASLAGDTDAFGQLVLNYQGLVWSIVNRALLPRAEVEDLAQETLLSAYEHLDQFNEEFSFGAWLCGIARNKLRMHLRAKACAVRHLEHYYNQLMRQLDEDDAANKSNRDLRDPRMIALRACQEELGEDAKILISLRYDDDLDFEIIARRLGRTVMATRRLLSRVRLRLRECIDGKATTV